MPLIVIVPSVGLITPGLLTDTTDDMAKSAVHVYNLGI